MLASNFAEAESVRMAITVLDDSYRFMEGPPIKTAVIVIDSDWLYKCLTDYVVLRWVKTEDGGLENKKKKKIKNGKILRVIDGMIEEHKERKGVQVRFWRVGKEWNKDASELANRAFDEKIGTEALSPIKGGFAVKADVASPVPAQMAASTKNFKTTVKKQPVPEEPLETHVESMKVLSISDDEPKAHGNKNLAFWDSDRNEYNRSSDPDYSSPPPLAGVHEKYPLSCAPISRTVSLESKLSPCPSTHHAHFY